MLLLFEFFSSSEGHGYKEINSDNEVTITGVDTITFPWKIPDFPVVTVQFRKVKYTHNGQELVGLVNKNETVIPGDVICTKHCTIEIDQTTYMVLWEFNKLVNNGNINKAVMPKPVPASMNENIGSNQPEEKEPTGKHTLPFKSPRNMFLQRKTDYFRKCL